MKRLRPLLLAAALLVPLFFTQCATAPQGPPQAYGGHTDGTAQRSGREPLSRNAIDGLLSQDAEMKRTGVSPAAPLAPEARQERPGLATGWGRKRNSEVGRTWFERDSNRPADTGRIYYNDAEGVAAMKSVTGSGWQWAPARVVLGGGLATAELQDHRGRMLNAWQKGSRLICQGTPGERYGILLENQCNHRLEIVLSVDGLDVMDGAAASFAKRGYVLDPGQRYRVEGFRTSLKQVAGFEFAAVSDSYAALRHGETRNVGVVGVAAFLEKGTRPVPLSGTDPWRRMNANPFATTPSDSGFARDPD